MVSRSRSNSVVVSSVGNRGDHVYINADLSLFLRRRCKLLEKRCVSGEGRSLELGLVVVGFSLSVLLLSAHVSKVSLLRAQVKLDLIENIDNAECLAKELSDWINELRIVIGINVYESIL